MTLLYAVCMYNYTYFLSARLMQAKLAQVPIYPWCVVGFWFVFGAAALFVLSSSVTLQFADWF